MRSSRDARVARQPAKVALPHRHASRSSSRTGGVGSTASAVRPLAAELAAEQHDGAQVLHRHREAELGHEVGPAGRAVRAAAGRRATSAATVAATTTATATRSTRWVRMPHMARLPMPSPGPGDSQAAAAIWAATRAAPTAVATQRGTRGRGRSWRWRRRPGRSSAPVAAPLAVHAAVEPGSRRAASWPAMPPASAPANAIDAEPLGDRPEQDVAPGHGRHHQVASVACFQRDRPAVAAAAQAEGDGRDGEQPDHGGAAIANRIELRTA